MRHALLVLPMLLAATVARAEGERFTSPTHFVARDGATLYSDVCQGCHMPDGRGAVGAGRYPALAGDARLDPPDYAVAMVLHGAGAMPAFGRMLNDDQVAAVVSYIRLHFGNAFSPPVSPDAVKAAR